MSTESKNKTATPRGVSSSAIVRWWCRVIGHDWLVSDAASTLSALSTEMRDFECWCDRCGIRGRADWTRFVGVKNFRESKPNDEMRDAKGETKL